MRAKTPLCWGRVSLSYFVRSLGFTTHAAVSNNLWSGKQPVLVWNGHYGFRICTRSNGQKGCPGKTGNCVPILAEPAIGQPYGMLWQSKPPANRSGIADGKHGVLGAPMHMQCKETHKCRQNKISWVRVKFSTLPSRVARNCRPPRASREEISRFVHYAHHSSELNVTVLYLIS